LGFDFVLTQSTVAIKSIAKQVLLKPKPQKMSGGASRRHSSSGVLSCIS